MHLIGKRLVRRSSIGASVLIAQALIFGLVNVAFCGAASAQHLTASVAWYGVYTTSKSKEIADPTVPTGKRYIVTAVAPDESTDRIPAKQLRFGLSYVLAGARRGTRVTVKHVYRFPPGGMPDKVNGGTRTTYELVEEHTVGQSILMGWAMAGTSIVPGPWTFEVWQGDRRLITKTFDVYKQ